mgnify:CR=1 FL=1
MRKVVAIIQARMMSSRLPGKMMLSLHGRPIIEWVVRRTVQANRLDDVIVAIPDTDCDDILAYFLNNKIKVKIFRGAENDVLRRFVEAGKYINATHVVRVCADNPLICSELIDELIEVFFKERCDYAYNQGDGGRTNTYPDGLGAEIVPFDLLQWLERRTCEHRHREHCLSYIHDNANQFKIVTFNPSDERIACPWLKLDVDTFEDYRRLALKEFEIKSRAYDIVKCFLEGK